MVPDRATGRRLAGVRPTVPMIPIIETSPDMGCFVPVLL